MPHPIKIDARASTCSVVQRPRRRGLGRAAPTLQAMQLDVEPCKRYYINAQFDNASVTQWKPVIDYVEPIAGCTVTRGE